ncbi:MAG: hypothetical protein OEZ03_00675 [Alphaproteobacteria bacterium]|nr:hypothetical protein [Alphaproteobacteria bacterium]
MTATEKIIQLRAEVARLSGGIDGSGATTEKNKKLKQELDDKLAQLGASLRPMHPDEEDVELASYFTLIGAEGLEDEEVLAALRDLGAVSAAYVKPSAEPA